MLVMIDVKTVTSCRKKQRHELGDSIAGDKYDAEPVGSLLGPRRKPGGVSDHDEPVRSIIGLSSL
jgi:hypothetical protein